MTKHSIERVKERANLNTSAAIKFINIAYEKGLKCSDLPANERKYLESKETAGITLRYFSGFCFVYTESKACITMYHAPSWFLKKTNYNGKIKIKNPKKYFNRYYFDMASM